MNEGSLCLKCKFFIAEDLTRSCPIANSFMVFCHNHKVDAVIISCKKLKDEEAVKSGHEFENDVMKQVQEIEAQQKAEQTMAEAETEAIEQAKDEALQAQREDEEKQRINEEGGSNE